MGISLNTRLKKLESFDQENESVNNSLEIYDYFENKISGFVVDMPTKDQKGSAILVDGSVREIEPIFTFSEMILNLANIEDSEEVREAEPSDMTDCLFLRIGGVRFGAEMVAEALRYVQDHENELLSNEDKADESMP